jgi:hypothetical protein
MIENSGLAGARGDAPFPLSTGPNSSTSTPLGLGQGRDFVDRSVAPENQHLSTTGWYLLERIQVHNLESQGESLDVEELYSLNTSLSSAAQYAARLLMHSPDLDTNAVDYCLEESMAAYVGGPPKPTPDVLRRPPRARLEEEKEATIRRGRDHGKEMPNSATLEPPPPPPPPTKRLLPREQEDILPLHCLPTLPPLLHGRAARHAPPRISGAPGARMAR